VTPADTGTFVFDNDFPALLPIRLATSPPAHRSFVSRARAAGRAYLFIPRHDLTLAEWNPAASARVDTGPSNRGPGRRDFIGYVRVLRTGAR